MIKNIQKTPPVNSTFNDRGGNAFPLRLRTRQEIFSHHCYSVVLEILADRIRQLKEIKGIYIIKKENHVYNSDDIENSKGFANKKQKTKNPCRVSEFSKFAGKKVNTHKKSQLYLYTLAMNMWKLKFKIKYQLQSLKKK